MVSINAGFLRACFVVVMLLKQLTVGIAQNTIEYWKEKAEAQKSLTGEMNADYALYLNNLAFYYNRMGDYKNACKYSKECLRIRKEVIGTSSPLYAQTLQNLAVYYRNDKQYEMALSTSFEEFKIDSLYLGYNHRRIAALWNNIAYDYLMMGDVDKALSYGLKSLGLKQEHFPQETMNIVNTLRLVSGCCNELADWQNAIKYTEEAMTLLKDIPNEDNRDCITLLNNLANYYYYLGQYSKAIKIGNQALEEEIKRGCSPELVKCMSNLSLFYSDNEENEKALSLLEKAEEIGLLIWGDKAEEMTTIYGNLSQCYLDMGNYLKASEYCQKALSIETDSIAKSTNMYQYANTLLSMEKMDEAMYWLKKCMEIFECSDKGYTNVYNANLSYVLGFYHWLRGNYSESEKFFAEYIKIVQWLKINLKNLSVKDREDFYDKWASVLTYIPCFLKKNASNEMCSIAFDAILEYKGLLLNPTYGDVTWQDIQKTLHMGDLAIEFVRFDSENGEEYGALLVASDYISPKYVRLFDTGQLSDVQNTPNQYSLVNKLVWNGLAEYLANAENVYFSACGILNNSPVEYYSRNFIAYRLSSTRLLAEDRHNITTPINYVLIGGVSYGTFPIDNYKIQAHAERGTLNDITKGTLVEVDSIAKMLCSHNLSYNLFIGDVSKDEIVKLSNSAVTNLHIATHGFFWNGKKKSRYVSSVNKALGVGANSSYEEQVLCRCGLLFSGAQDFFNSQNDSISSIEYDGILTGMEISRLNLKDLDMAVLSACQTGLGDNQFNEGSYGLLRAFKKAGAHTIMSTLWDIDDTATQLFMTEFYRHYLDGESKVAALKAAQQYLRNYEEDGERIYDSPKYWAAFVLLDAI